MFTVTGAKVSITSIKVGASTVNAENYTYSDDSDTLTIKGSYLSNLTAGDKVFTITTNGGEFTRTISVVDTTPTTATFSKAAPADIAVTIAGTTTLTAVKNGTATLVKDTDYSVASGVVTLKKEYFAALDNGDVTITLVTSVDDFTCVVTVAA